MAKKAMETLGEYIKRVLKESGLKPEEVKKASGGRITEGYVRSIMTGRANNPSIKKLQALAHGLGVSEEEIFRVARGLPLDGSGSSDEDLPDYRVIINLLHASIRNRGIRQLLHEAAKLSAEQHGEAVLMLKMLNERKNDSPRKSKRV